MKKSILILMTFMVALFSCDKANTKEKAAISIQQKTFLLKAGQEFILCGEASDPAGIYAVTATCDALDIRTKIDVPSQPKTYDFHMEIKIPERAMDGSYKLTVELVNASGVACTTEVTLKVLARERVDFHLGSDISWVTEMEAKGQNFKNAEGNPTDCYSLMEDYGINALRFRVWVDPKEHDNWCNLADLLVKCKRAAEMNFDIMVDFHYSDWWADPGSQGIPAAWKDHSYEQMKEDLAAHTIEVLQTLKDNGITPQWVQVGNETDNGFLWPVGQADKNPEQYAGLFKAGYEAVKSVFPETKVIVHLSSGGDTGRFDWNLDILKNGGAKWDIIGMSAYTSWSDNPDATIDQCIHTMKVMSKKFGCDMMVVETGMICAENGMLASKDKLKESKRQLDLLIRKCKETSDAHCKGVFYWEPECRPEKYAFGAFDGFGQPTVIMDAFKENR